MAKNYQIYCFFFSQTHHDSFIILRKSSVFFVQNCIIYEDYALEHTDKNYAAKGGGVWHMLTGLTKGGGGVGEMLTKGGGGGLGKC